MRACILRQVASILADRPIDQLNMQAMARLTGISLWALRYHFGTFEGLFRAAVMHMMEQAQAGLPSCRPRQNLSPQPTNTVVGAIQAYASALRKAVSTTEYRSMVCLVLRYGSAHRWIRDAYERDIVGKICVELSDHVLAVSERVGTPILFRDGVTRRFHRRIETEFVLRDILSPLEALPEEASESLLRDIVHEAFLGTYCFDWRDTNAA
jgi:AcrR family transcriptional regulator